MLAGVVAESEVLQGEGGGPRDERAEKGAEAKYQKHRVPRDSE
jgi:hypothetical protein